MVIPEYTTNHTKVDCMIDIPCPQRGCIQLNLSIFGLAANLNFLECHSYRHSLLETLSG